MFAGGQEGGPRWQLRAGQNALKARVLGVCETASKHPKLLMKCFFESDFMDAIELLGQETLAADDDIAAVDYIHLFYCVNRAMKNQGFYLRYNTPFFRICYSMEERLRRRPYDLRGLVKLLEAYSFLHINASLEAVILDLLLEELASNNLNNFEGFYIARLFSIARKIANDTQALEIFEYFYQQRDFLRLVDRHSLLKAYAETALAVKARDHPLLRSVLKELEELCFGPTAIEGLTATQLCLLARIWEQAPTFEPGKGVMRYILKELKENIRDNTLIPHSHSANYSILTFLFAVENRTDCSELYEEIIDQHLQIFNDWSEERLLYLRNMAIENLRPPHPSPHPESTFMRVHRCIFTRIAELTGKYLPTLALFPEAERELILHRYMRQGLTDDSVTLYTLLYVVPQTKEYSSLREELHFRAQAFQFPKLVAWLPSPDASRIRLFPSLMEKQVGGHNILHLLHFFRACPYTQEKLLQRIFSLGFPSYKIILDTADCRFIDTEVYLTFLVRLINKSDNLAKVRGIIPYLRNYVESRSLFKEEVNVDEFVRVFQSVCARDNISPVKIQVLLFSWDFVCSLRVILAAVRNPYKVFHMLAPHIRKSKNCAKMFNLLCEYLLRLPPRLRPRAVQLGSSVLSCRYFLLYASECMAEESKRIFETEWLSPEDRACNPRASPRFALELLLPLVTSSVPRKAFLAFLILDLRSSLLLEEESLHAAKQMLTAREDMKMIHNDFLACINEFASDL